MTTPPPPTRVFLLSPANAGGKRARLLVRPEAAFPLAVRLREAGTVPLGDAFAFLSGLYFRGKLAYARHFGRAPHAVDSAQVITAGRGVLPASAPVTRDDLAAFAAFAIDPADARYRDPLVRDAERLVAAGIDELVLLGSIATAKYADLLVEAVGDRLRFPSSFVGRGDMSRGAIMLRAVREDAELDYENAAAAARRARITLRRRPAS